MMKHIKTGTLLLFVSKYNKHAFTSYSHIGFTDATGFVYSDYHHANNEKEKEYDNKVYKSMILTEIKRSK